MVGAAAGGPTDTIARNLAPYLRASLGQVIVIENNGAAAGSIVHGRTAHAAPDGYTLSLGHSLSHATNGAIYNLPYDVVKDFEPVSLISSVSALFVARSTLPANDLPSFLSWLKGNDKALQGIAQGGSPDHIAGVLLQSNMGVR
jgi:tripartite-type tricarboxylate transporter receptor subunit TctC